jgi:hypothetical protein
MSSRPYQTNASDPRQVRASARAEEKREAAYIGSLKAVLATPEGRRVLAELLDRAGLYKTSWDPSARIHFNEGRRNFGLELLANIQDADEALYLEMEREMRVFKRSLEQGPAAARAVSEGEKHGS